VIFFNVVNVQGHHTMMTADGIDKFSQYVMSDVVDGGLNRSSVSYVLYLSPEGRWKRHIVQNISALRMLDHVS
jgi:hypothetical protein